MEHATEVDTLASKLMADNMVQLGQCQLIRNTVCDCILGTDPLGIDAVAAYTADPKGCRDAIAWAMRANGLVTPARAH